MHLSKLSELTERKKKRGYSNFQLLKVQVKKETNCFKFAYFFKSIISGQIIITPLNPNQQLGVDSSKCISQLGII
jgi:hypothetical protein